MVSDGVKRVLESELIKNPAAQEAFPATLNCSAWDSVSPEKTTACPGYSGRTIHFPSGDMVILSMNPTPDDTKLLVAVASSNSHRVPSLKMLPMTTFVRSGVRVYAPILPM